MRDIVLNGICKSFGDKWVLNNVSAVFPAGKTSCIWAASGVGKTTLLRIMMGLEKSDRGSMSGLEDAKLSVVFQEDRLCEAMTVAENARLVVPEISDSDISAAMRAVGLTDCEAQPVCELSGGMRRRAAIVRAVLYGGDVLMLDEPFKGLDEQTKRSVTEFIRTHFFGKTVILITHDENEAKALVCEYSLKL